MRFGSQTDGLSSMQILANAGLSKDQRQLPDEGLRLKSIGSRGRRHPKARVEVGYRAAFGSEILWPTKTCILFEEGRCRRRVRDPLEPS